MRVLKCVVGMLCIAAVSVGASNGTCEVECQSCGAGMSAIHNLLRITPSGHRVTSNLGYYNIFDCDPDTGKCSLAKLDTKQLLPKGTIEDPQSLSVYIQVCVLIVFVLSH